MSWIQAVRAKAALVLVLLLWVAPVHAQGIGGIGIYPSVIEWTDAVRGSEYFSDVVVLNGQDTEMTVRVEDGRMFLLFGRERVGDPGVGWITIHPVEDRTRTIDTFTVPPHSEGRVILRARVPVDVANGTYSGTVYFNSVAALPGTGSAEGSRTSVSLGVATDIQLVVKGAQRLSGTVTDSYVADTEPSYPLRLTTTFQNTGNVLARPQIDLTVKNAAGQAIGAARFADRTFNPGETQSVSGDWDTTGATEGEYIAAVKVSLAGESIYERDLGFKILPRGTLTRFGSFERLAIEEQPRPGTVGKAVATFFNTGRIDSRAKFVGELYKGSTRIDTVSSEERLVPYGEKQDLELFLRVPDAGDYTLRGKVNFEGKETITREVNFVVAAGGWPLGQVSLIVAALLAMGALGAGAVAVSRRKGLRPSPKLSKLSS